jgi:integrase
MTLKKVFDAARQRGRFQGENPFADQRRKAAEPDRPKFTNQELQTVFNALPREIKPAKHTADNAMTWAALISLYGGLRLEEVCQLSGADIKEVGTNGSRVWCFDIHNGGKNHLKNKSSERKVPIHNQLIRAGLLDYAKAVPQNGALFPTLQRRKSKGDKIGARVGELFRKRLISLGIKAEERKGLCFHSLRHNFGRCLDVADVSERDAARLMGHKVKGITFGVYGEGELENLASIVQRAIKYEGLTLSSK